jgi:hypothetical protein
MTTGDLTLLDGLYDPGNPQLIAFEKSRETFFHSGLGAKWHARVPNCQSTVYVVNLNVSASDAQVRLYESLDVTWIPLPRPAPILTPEAAAWRREAPERCQPSPTGPNGGMHALIGVRHELELMKSGNGWTIIRDGYHEPGIFGTSPDFTPGSWADDGGPGPAAGVDAVGATHTTRRVGQFRDMGSCLVDWSAVQSYAKSWCSGRNTGYCNYCNLPYCGGDCANFVSQCWSNGNHHWDGTWFCAQNYACNCHDTPSVAWGGSTAWVNVIAQHNWVVTTGWGSDFSNQNNLIIGDIVNYDWTGDGVWDHVSIVSSFDQSGYPLISCHCNDMCGVPWYHGGASKYRFTHVNTSYPC